MHSTPGIRRADIVERSVGDSVILAIPGTEEIRMLGPTAAAIWRSLGTVRTVDGLYSVLQQFYPDVPEAERLRAVDEVVSSLESDDLVVLA